MSYSIRVKASAISQFEFETITLPKGLMGYAPQSLIDRIKKGEISEQGVKDNTEKLVTMIFRKNAESQVRRFRPKELEILHDLLSPPIKINPCVYVDNWKSSSLAGHTLLGALLVEESCPLEIIGKLIKGGVDCSKFPNEPFIHAAAMFQPVEAFDLLKKAGANITHEHRIGHNACYNVLNDNNPNAAARLKKLDWLLYNGVDGYSALLPNPHPGGGFPISPFEYQQIGKVESAPMTIGMLERGMGQFALRRERGELKLRALNGKWLEGNNNNTAMEYFLDVRTELNNYLKREKPIASITPAELTRIFSIDRLKDLKEPLLTIDGPKLLTLYDAVPPPVKHELSFLHPVLATHIARTEIQGPAQSWGVIAAATTERGKE